MKASEFGVVGIETEFGMERTDRVMTGPERNVFFEAFFDVTRKPNPYGIPGPGSKSLQKSFIGSLLVNGARLYRDVEKLEFSTPECKTLQDVALFREAGRSIAADIISISQNRQRMREGNQPPQHLLFAINCDHRFTIDSNKEACPNVWGTHENYSDGLEEELPAMWGFLVTRDMFAGPGFILPEELQQKYGVDFATSARALATHVYQEDKTIKIRNHKEVLSLKGGRLHNALASETMSPKATMLAVGSTMLVHRMAKEGFKPFPMCQATPEELVDALHAVAIAPGRSDKRKWDIKMGGDTLSALTVQRVYLREAQKRYGNLEDPDIEWTLSLWKKSLDALSSEEGQDQANWIDWVLKGKCLDLLGSVKGLTPEKIDLGYHRADSADNFYNWISNKLGVGEDPGWRSKVRAARLNPPTDTRAYDRGIVTQALAKMPASFDDEVLTSLSGDWATLSTKHSMGGEVALTIDDPQGHSPWQVDNYLKTIQSW